MQRNNNRSALETQLQKYRTTRKQIQALLDSPDTHYLKKRMASWHMIHVTEMIESLESKVPEMQ